MTLMEDQILEILNEDLLRLEDIYACMIARKNLEGITAIPKDFEEEIIDVWDVLKRTMDEIFDVIKEYSKYGLDKIYFELGEYDVIFFVLPGSDTALVAIVPALANRGLLEVELENARRRIVEIIEGE